MVVGDVVGDHPGHAGDRGRHVGGDVRAGRPAAAEQPGDESGHGRPPRLTGMSTALTLPPGVTKNGEQRGLVLPEDTAGVGVGTELVAHRLAVLDVAVVDPRLPEVAGAVEDHPRLPGREDVGSGAQPAEVEPWDHVQAVLHLEHLNRRVDRDMVDGAP